jgi:predicted nucleic acid-binding protein
MERRMPSTAPGVAFSDEAADRKAAPIGGFNMPREHSALAQLDELRRASRYPKFQAVLQPHRVGAMVNNLQRAVVLEQLLSDIAADDPNDAFLLAMASAGNADYLVTGDRRARLLQRRNIGRTRYCYARQFLFRCALIWIRPYRTGS